ncbi:MAG: nucleotidyltransferase family protein [Candidatus Heimdallarchaeaceae archaeon]
MNSKGLHKYTVEFPLDIWRILQEKKGPGSIKDFLVYLIEKEFELRKIKAFILAGGEGARLKPLTESIPKAMIPVGYKPLLEYNLQLLAKHGISDVNLLIGKLGDRVMQYFGQSWNGIELNYVTESTMLDTAGALFNAKNLISGTFLVMNSDILTNIRITDLIEFHKRRRGDAIATVAGISLSHYQQKMMNKTKEKAVFNDYGVFQVEESDGHKIIRFDERPPKGQQDGYIDAGVYIFEPEIIEYLEDSEGKSLSRDIFPKLIKEQKLKLYPCEKSIHWIDVAHPIRWSIAWDLLISGAIEV